MARLDEVNAQLRDSSQHMGAHGGGFDPGQLKRREALAAERASLLAELGYADASSTNDKGRNTVRGWVILAGSVIAIIGIVSFAAALTL
jgi:hypothetical protein